PAGTSLAAADAAAERVEGAIAELDAVETYQVTGGAGDAAMAFFGSANETMFSLTLDLDADAVAAEERLRDLLADVEDAGEVTVATGMAGFGGSLEVVVSGASGEDVE